MLRLAFALLMTLGSTAARAEGLLGTGLNISAAADIVGSFELAQGSASNRLDPREGEIVLYAPADQLFDGQLSAAAHQESNGAFFEIHEMFIGSTKLIPRSRFRVGQFFLGYGRLQQFHRHDWPFISAPRVHLEVSRTNEAALDTGVEYSWLTPLPFFFDVTVGVTNGWVFGHAHSIGTKPATPTHYLRTVNYFSLPGHGGTQIGLNYVGRKDASGTQTTLFGLDATAKWKEASFLKVLFQSEYWLQIISPNTGNTEYDFGFYLYPAYSFDQNWTAGLRIDGWTVLNLKNAVGTNTSNFEWGLVPQIQYKSSEFTTVRLTYNWLHGTSGGVTVKNQHLVEIQAVFILGTHPAHDF